MRKRLDWPEKRRVRESCADDELFRVIMKTGPELESELSGFGLSPEECLLEVRELVDTIRGLEGVRSRNLSVLVPELRVLWTEKHNEYRALDRQVDAEESCKVVGIVFAFATVVVESSGDPFFYTTLARLLVETIGRHDFTAWGTTLQKIFDFLLPEGWLDSRPRLVGGDDAGSEADSVEADIPQDCKDAVDKVFTRGFTPKQSNGAVLQSRRQMMKAARTVALERNPQLAMLMRVGQEVGAVKAGCRPVDFVRALIGLSILPPMDKKAIEYRTTAMARKLNGCTKNGKTSKPLPQYHRQWSTKDQPVGEQIYQAMISEETMASES